MGKAIPRDPAVTEYVRFRVRPILDNKEMTGEEMARRVGVSPATISTLGSTGIGGRSIDGFATLLGFKDANELRNTAYDWWRDQQPKTTARAEDPAVISAIEKLKELQPWVRDEQIRTILHRFAHPDFDGSDESYWFMTLGQAIAQDTLRAQRAAAEAASRSNDRAREKKKIQSAFREASTVKKQLAEAEAVAELEAPKLVPKDEESDTAVGSSTETQIRPTSLRGRRKKQA